MSQCQRCHSSRLCFISSKCADLFTAQIGEEDYRGYVPHDLNLKGGDYVTFGYCLDCGQMLGTFPLPVTAIEADGVAAGCTCGLDDQARLVGDCHDSTCPYEQAQFARQQERRRG